MATSPLAGDPIVRRTPARMQLHAAGSLLMFVGYLQPLQDRPVRRAADPAAG